MKTVEMDFSHAQPGQVVSNCLVSCLFSTCWDCEYNVGECSVFSKKVLSNQRIRKLGEDEITWTSAIYYVVLPHNKKQKNTIGITAQYK